MNGEHPQHRVRPPVPLREPSALQCLDGTFTNSRGQTLSYCALVPSLKKHKRSITTTACLSGVLVFLHPLGDHCRRYLHVYEQICTENNFAVITFDQCSHGLSASCAHNIRTHVRKFQYFVDDTNEFLTFAKQELYSQLGFLASSDSFPPPLIMTGMCVGALVALHTVLSGKHTFNGIILVAPAVAVEWTPVLRIQAVFSKPLSLLIPKVHVVPGVPPERMCRDPAFIADFENDPLTTFAALTARMGAEIFHAMQKLAKDKRLQQPSSVIGTMPLLLMIGSDDRVVNMPVAKRFFDHLGNRDKEFKLFDGAFHALFHDPEQEDVVETMVDWLRTRFGENSGGSLGSSSVLSGTASSSGNASIFEQN